MKTLKIYKGEEELTLRETDHLVAEVDIDFKYVSERKYARARDSHYEVEVKAVRLAPHRYDINVAAFGSRLKEAQQLLRDSLNRVVDGTIHTSVLATPEDGGLQSWYNLRDTCPGWYHVPTVYFWREWIEWLKEKRTEMLRRYVRNEPLDNSQIEFMREVIARMREFQKFHFIGIFADLDLNEIEDDLKVILRPDGQRRFR